MKTLIWLFSGLLFLSTPAFAEDNSNENEKKELSPVEDLAERLTVIKPEQYKEMVAPIRRDAHRTAQKLSKAEAMILINAQNKINKVIAYQNNEPEPEPINIDPTDKVGLELLVLPPIYTYDTPILTHE